MPDRAKFSSDLVPFLPAPIGFLFKLFLLARSAEAHFEPLPEGSRPFSSVSDIFINPRKHSSTPSTRLTNRGLVGHPSRSDRIFIAEIDRLNLEVDAGEIQEWALEIMRVKNSDSDPRWIPSLRAAK